MNQDQGQPSGCFISVEGIEGVGKSTNLSFIQEWLEAQGKTVITTREPGGTPMAEQIRDLLLQTRSETVAPATEALLMFASRAQHVQEVILPALQRGDCVLSDRFTDASFAYQGYGRGFSLEDITWLEKFALANLKPNLTFFLDAPLEVGFARVAQRDAGLDRIEQEKQTFFHRVRDGYLQIAKDEPERVRVIDASQALDAVQADIAAVLKEALQTQVVSP